MVLSRFSQQSNRCLTTSATSPQLHAWICSEEQRFPQMLRKRTNLPADWLLLPFQFSPHVLSTSTCAPAEAACQPACDVTDMTTAWTARMRSAPLPHSAAASSIHQHALSPNPQSPVIHLNIRAVKRLKGSDTCCFLSRQIGCVKECREDEFLCLNRAHCIPRRWRCDDVFDCMDHSDEENCSQGRRGRARARAQTTGWRCDADGLINDITAPRRTSDDFISGLCWRCCTTQVCRALPSLRSLLVPGDPL